ncbi:MAG: hypothetical protein M1829_001867 [Trizodia sp. TS-e1964]|nr:MAG: hypothetical protein M1829_001867 [Trizodia sp. TS-e1964]
MLPQALRLSRSPLRRLALLHNAAPSRRTLIIPTAARQSDLVQELYLKEIKSFKATPIKASDSEGHVQKFSVPKPPPSPEETNIAQDLKAYEDQEVEIEGGPSAAEETPVEEEEDWFEDDEREGSGGH